MPKVSTPGKPSALVLQPALAASPLDSGYPVTVWTVADLHVLLGRHGYQVNLPTVYRTLGRLGYRYRWPWHDLTHRQDARRYRQCQACARGAPRSSGVPSLLSTYL